MGMQVKAVVMNHGSFTEKEHIERLKQPLLINQSDKDKVCLLPMTLPPASLYQEAGTIVPLMLSSNLCKICSVESGKSIVQSTESMYSDDALHHAQMISREKLAVYQGILDCKKDLPSDVKVFLTFGDPPMLLVS